MKKIVCIALIFFVLIGCLLVLTGCNKNNSTNEISVDIETDVESKEMTDNDYYEKAAEYVKTETPKTEEHINTKPEYNKFVEYEGFGVEEVNGTTYAYMWIVDMSYYKEDGELVQGSGSSMAYKVEFKDGEVIKCENPTDGAGQEESIREMFPEDVADKILKYNFDFSRIDNAVEEYYNK